MYGSITDWRHVFKLDPEREISDDALRRICLSGTDGLIVGGSTGITYDNLMELLGRLRLYDTPVWLEVSDREAIVPGFDGYFIPVALNTRNPDWLIGHHIRTIRDFGDALPWDLLLAQGYIVLNPDSAVARVTEAYVPTEPDEVAALAQYADKLLNLPIVYLEYSGIYGDIALVQRIRSRLRQARLFYGGGIDGPERAAEALEAADTIVVGNIIYSDLEAALSTVRAKIT